jgi:CHAT domain-containing protein
MTLEQKAGLPFGESFPVHVQISIFSNGSEYMAYISADMGMFYRIPIQLRPHDIKDLNKDLQCSNASQPEKGFTDFGRFLQRDHHIMHLACHAREAEPVYQSYLWITDEFKISIKDFVVHEFEIKSNPFVILNACLTSVINPLHTYYWAAEFWKRGARGVLATDFHVPDSFAAAFSEELYSHLLDGEPVGEALLATRQHFWTKYNNPLGLAYALYSSPSIRIVHSN